jgi:hypothetical protein
LANRAGAILPPNAKRSDIRKILDVAGEHYDEIVAAWEKMQHECEETGAHHDD